jgi:hypothetical protein
VIQYADKNKEAARQNTGFAETTPAIIRPLLSAAGYRILEEDTTTLWHSNIVRFAIASVSITPISHQSHRRSYSAAGGHDTL